MSIEDERILHQQKNNAQEKYTYFLLATAAAAIGFSVQQTAGKPLVWSQLPLGAAVGCWGYSFWCGCRRVVAAEESLSMNLTATRARNEADAIFPDYAT